jgi:uncharacterized protein (UPF0335 family)
MGSSRGPTVSSDSVAQDQLRAFVERIERMEEEKKAIADDIKEIYAEAKGNGFDTKVLRQVIRIRKQDHAERMEQEALLELYLAALGMAEGRLDEGAPSRRPFGQSANESAAPAQDEEDEGDRGDEVSGRRPARHPVRAAVRELQRLADKDGATISVIHGGKETVIAQPREPRAGH